MTRIIKLAGLCVMLAAVVVLAGCTRADGGNLPPLTAARANLPRPAAAEENFLLVRRDGTVSHIYLMHIDAAGQGSDPRRLTGDPQAEGNPAWSPDGQRIAYTRDLDGSAIYVINANGTGQRRLSPVPGMDTTPSWSPDGTKIVYTRLLSPPGPGAAPPMTQIRVMNADGTGDHVILGRTRVSIEPRWSVRNQIIFASLMHGSQLEIYRMNADGSGLVQLTFTAINSDPRWSPDGTRICFGSDRQGGANLNLYLMDADGSHLVQLTHFAPPVEAGDSDWSPDGSKIAFERDINGHRQSDPAAFAQIWTINANGTDPASSGIQASGVGASPRWRPATPTARQDNTRTK
jgi:Tol biopolymer transport system component